MDFDKIINSINTKEDFLNFLIELKNNKITKKEEWENGDIESYLDSICSWVDDMEGYFQNMNIDVPQNIDWRFIATLFYVGKIYE